MSNKRTDFSFAMNIAKSSTADTDKMVIRGVASGTLRDKQGDKFSVKGLEAIKKSIEDGIVDQETGEWGHIPLRSGHRTEWEDVLGYVTKSWLDPESNLWIEAELDEDSSKAQELYRKLSKGKVKLGLSVRGQVTDYHYDYDPDIQKAGIFFDNLLTKEISVTSQPVYPMSYPIAIAKSLISDPQYQEGLEEFMSNIEVSKADKDYASLPGRENEQAEASEVVEQEVVADQDAAVVDAEKSETDPRVEASEAIARGLTGNEDTATEPEEVKVVEAVADAGNVETKQAPEDDYVALPNTESTPQEASQQENSDAVADPAQNDDLAEKLATLQVAFDELKALVANQGTQEAKKAESEPVVEETPVEVTKADSSSQLSPEALQAQIVSAVKATFEELGIVKALKDVEVMKGAVEEMSGQPVDRSISVQKAKDSEDENDPLIRYKKLVEQGEDSIMAAMSTSFRGSR